MPHHVTSLYGNRLGARDGDIGHVQDFYFDDRRWQIRYVVADTGSWLPRRKVLLSPHAFGPLEQQENCLLVNLSQKQIEDSPSIDAHRPISRHYETEYFRYYGWPVYWVGDGFGGFGGFSGAIYVPPDSEQSGAQHTPREDRHLRSTRVVTGYRVQARDGAAGQVSDFVVDDKSWAIRELIVRTGHWYSARQVRISPHDIEAISYDQSVVSVVLTQDDFERAAENSVASAGGAHRHAVESEE